MRAMDSVPPLSMKTRPVKSTLLPVRVTIPLESDGIVSTPSANPAPVFSIGPLTVKFLPRVLSLKSVALRLKLLFPTLIVPENTPLLPPEALRVAPPPTMVIVFGIVEFKVASSAPPARVTPPPVGRLEAFTARVPPFTRVTPPRGLLMFTTVAPPKVRACVVAALSVGSLRVTIAFDPTV